MSRYIGLGAHASSLHARGHDAKREASRIPCGGDERTVPDRSGAADPEAAAPLPRGRHAVGVAVRGALAPRREGGGGGR